MPLCQLVAATECETGFIIQHKFVKTLGYAIIDDLIHKCQFKNIKLQI